MHTADLVRAKTFNIRFSEEELARLDKVAEHYALTAAAVIRMLVKREADAIAAGRPGGNPDDMANVQERVMRDLLARAGNPFAGQDDPPPAPKSKPSKKR